MSKATNLRCGVFPCQQLVEGDRKVFVKGVDLRDFNLAPHVLQLWMRGHHGINGSLNLFRPHSLCFWVLGKHRVGFVRGNKLEGFI